MRIIGEKPKPRGLIWGFDDEAAGRLEGLFSTSRRILDPKEVRQAEWDVVVADQDLVSIENHLYSVALGSSWLGSTKILSKEWVSSVSVEFVGDTMATEFAIPDGLDPRLRVLVERQLLPLAQSRAHNPVLTFQTRSQRPATPAAREGKLTPFLQTTEPAILAGSFTRADTEAEIWCLPPGLKDPTPWVAAALSIWHAKDPTTFPIDPLWRDNPKWLTHEERTILRSLREVEEAKRIALAELGAQEEALYSQLDEARRSAGQGAGRLLTGSGEGLVQAVAEALRDLGFEVSNRDEVNPPHDRREDLWVTCPQEDPEWIAIVEVRSYAKGAAQGDLLRLGARFAKRFIREQGREPSRMWYIVNQYSGGDPSSRPPVLAANPDEVATFAEEGGLVMDSSSLFELLNHVRDGDVTEDEARRRLTGATGRWAE